MVQIIHSISFGMFIKQTGSKFDQIAYSLPYIYKVTRIQDHFPKIG